jgi:hypothetical protein
MLALLPARRGKEMRKASSERHLFEKQVEFFEIYRPRAAMIAQSLGNRPAATASTRETSENWKGTNNGGGEL